MRPAAWYQPPRKGLEGREAFAALRGEWSKAEPRKARSPPLRGGDAPKLPCRFKTGRLFWEFSIVFLQEMISRELVFMAQYSIQ
jgi:hypothetical protein